MHRRERQAISPKAFPLAADPSGALAAWRPPRARMGVIAIGLFTKPLPRCHSLPSSEKWLARVLLLLANFGKKDAPEPIGWITYTIITFFLGFAIISAVVPRNPNP
jgi:hypothetical protein